MTRDRSMLSRLCALGALALAACEYPSGLPQWETTWYFPGSSVRLEVYELLPSSMELTADGESLVLRLQGLESGMTLGSLCSPCGALSGLTAPKPAFTLRVAGEIEFPREVISIEMTGGTINLLLTHDLGFDPIHPKTGSWGSITIEARTGERLLARTVVDGSVGFPSGVTRAVTLALRPGEVAGGVEVVVVLDSPAGGAVAIDTARGLRFRAEPSGLAARQAVVRLSPRWVDFGETDLGLADVDGEVLDRIERGILHLAVANPFALAADLDLALTGQEVVLRRTVRIEPGASEVRVEFTGDELESLLSSGEIDLGATGTVTAPSGVVTLAPRDALVLAAGVELVLEARR